MKKTLCLCASVAMLITGCTTYKQVLFKSTVFGLQASVPGYSAVQFGLIRSEYLSNPTGTNPVYCAPFTSHVQANLNPISQSATEDINQ